MSYKDAERFAEDYAQGMLHSIGLILNGYEKRLIAMGYYEGAKVRSNERRLSDG